MARLPVNIVSTQIRNYIINGNFDFWQRNTSFSSPVTGSYLADRYRVDFDGTIGTYSISRQTFTLGQTDVPGNPSYFLRWNHTVAGSGSTNRVLQQLVEGVRTLAGKNVTLSLYAKADSARTVGVSMEQFFGTGGSPSSAVTLATQNINLTTVWQKFTLTFNVPSISGKTIGTDGNDYTNVTFRMPINVVMTIDLSRIMLNDGVNPADFKLAGENLEGELALCQRYFEKSYDMETPIESAPVFNGAFAVNGVGSNNRPYFTIPFVTRKRRVPTVVGYNPQTAATSTPIYDVQNTASFATSTFAPSQVNIVVTPSGTPAAGGGLYIHWIANAEF